MRLYICFLVLLIGYPIYGQITHNEVEKVVIEYSYYDPDITSYAEIICNETYKLNGNVYKLQNNKNEEEPECISSMTINEFLKGLGNEVVDSCEYYLISNDDIRSYKHFIQEYGKDKKNCVNYNLLYPIEEEKYLSIPDTILLKLSCNDISEALSSPNDLYILPMGVFSLLFHNTDGHLLRIRPFGGYQGDPWIVEENNNYYLVNNYYVTDFLKKIKYYKYVESYNIDRYYMILHVVNYLLNHRNF